MSLYDVTITHLGQAGHALSTPYRGSYSSSPAVSVRLLSSSRSLARTLFPAPIVGGLDGAVRLGVRLRGLLLASPQAVASGLFRRGVFIKWSEALDHASSGRVKRIEKERRSPRRVSRPGHGQNRKKRQPGIAASFGRASGRPVNRPAMPRSSVRAVRPSPDLPVIPLPFDVSHARAHQRHYLSVGKGYRFTSAFQRGCYPCLLPGTTLPC